MCRLVHTHILRHLTLALLWGSSLCADLVVRIVFFVSKDMKTHHLGFALITSLFELVVETNTCVFNMFSCRVTNKQNNQKHLLVYIN